VILSDQNFTPLLPLKENSCPAIIRIEDGSLKELGDSFCCLLGEHTLPEGSVMAIGSMSHLQKAGLAAYSDKMVTECRRFRAMFKNQIIVLPFVPIPLCGTDDPNLVKRLLTYTYYLDSLTGSCHGAFSNAIRCFINEQILENTMLMDHP